jgi:hypothetical protein
MSADRVNGGLFHLRKGLAAFVEARMKRRHGANWLHYASRAHGSPPNAPLDAYGLLKTMIDSWRDVFDEDPIAIDEAQALSLVVLGPSTPHSGKGVGKSAARDAVSETLMRCRSSQRRFRNTLLFAAADEGLLGTAREAMRKAIAWDEICNDKRLQAQITQAQAADTRDKAKTSRDGAAKAVRLAWSHILFPIKTDATAAGIGLRPRPPLAHGQGSCCDPAGRLR